MPLEPIKQDNELENEILNKDFLFSLPMQYSFYSSKVSIAISSIETSGSMGGDKQIVKFGS